MTIILAAVAMLAILITAAVVLDMSVVRQSRQSNKSSSDFAVTAGLRGLETAVGVPRPWGGVCAAIESLKVNHEDMASLSGTYMTADGSTTFATDPCADVASAPYTTLCTPGDLGTWARFEGTAGRLSVEIQSGYRLDTDSRFPEDGDEYAGDVGELAQNGCDQLAVIISETDDAMFGRVVGESGYDTAIRSVGRVKIGSISVETVALLLLEGRDCQVLVTEGNNTYVRVRATPIAAPTHPGLIHSNSDGTGADCGGGNRIIEGSNVCPALTNCVGNGPSVVAEDVSTTTPGKIGVRAVGTAMNGRVSTPSCTSGTTPTAGCTVAPVPINRGAVSRAPVDVRYLAHARALKTAATNSNPSGYFHASNNGQCNALRALSPVSIADTGGNPKVYMNCDVTVGNTETLQFDDSITDLVIDGDLRVNGTFEARNLRTFYVKGSNGVDISGTFRVNNRGAADCTARFNSFPRTEVTKLVVTNGPFTAGGGVPRVQLCNTFLFLSQGTLPSSDGTPPANNAFNGRIDIGSQSLLDWKAPNQTDLPLSVGDPLFGDFEDMALWTEYSGNGSPGNAARIGGQGGVVTTGVYFLPNANPFNIAGGGAGAIIEGDAQFIVRKLRLSGTVALTMAPTPENSVPTPVFEGFGLIR